MMGLRMVPSMRLTMTCAVCGHEVDGKTRRPLCRIECQLRMSNCHCPACDSTAPLLEKQKVDRFLRRVPIRPRTGHVDSMYTVNSALMCLEMLGEIPHYAIGMSQIRGLFDVGCGEYHHTDMDEKVQLLLKLIELGFKPKNLVRAVAEVLRHKGYPEFEIKSALTEGHDALLAHLRRRTGCGES